MTQTAHPVEHDSDSPPGRFHQGATPALTAFESPPRNDENKQHPARWRRSNQPYPPPSHLATDHYYHSASLRGMTERQAKRVDTASPRSGPFSSVRLLDVPASAERGNVVKLLHHIVGKDGVYALRHTEAAATHHQHVWHVDVPVAEEYALLSLSKQVWLSNTGDVAYMPMPSRITCTLRHTFHEATVDSVAIVIKLNTGPRL